MQLKEGAIYGYYDGVHVHVKMPASLVVFQTEMYTI